VDVLGRPWWHGYLRAAGYWTLYVVLSGLSLLFLLLYSGVKGEPFYRTAAQDGTLYVLAGVLVASGYVVYLSELRGILRQIGHLLEFWLGAFGFLIPVIAAILYSITGSERPAGDQLTNTFK
jgi:hypothetical protein